MSSAAKMTLWKRIPQRLQHEIQWRQHLWRPVGLPRYVKETPCVAGTCFAGNADMGDWYSPILINPATIEARASSAACAREVIRVLRKLEPDPYVRYLVAYYEAGLARFGDYWRYADLATVLLAVSQLIQPRRYLEVGVRRGRSMAMVAATCPQCDMVGFDMWVERYAGAENPGPGFVERELEKIGFEGRVEFITGDSHRTLPEYFRTHLDDFFDLITVDGDHSQRGASLDLRDVLPRLKVGGVITFDDIVQPGLGYLKDVWGRYVANQPRFVAWEFGELGYGIAVGIRKY